MMVGTVVPARELLVNFAEISDEEVLVFFLEPKRRKNLCGRFTDHQLTNGIEQHEYSRKEKNSLEKPDFRKSNLLGAEVDIAPILFDILEIKPTKKPIEEDSSIGLLIKFFLKS